MQQGSAEAGKPADQAGGKGIVLAGWPEQPTFQARRSRREYTVPSSGSASSTSSGPAGCRSWRSACAAVRLLPPPMAAGSGGRAMREDCCSSASRRLFVRRTGGVSGRVAGGEGGASSAGC